MELRQFDKEKVVKKPREDSTSCPQDPTPDTSERCAKAEGDWVVNELEIKELHECSEGEIESMSIDSVHLN